MCNEARTSLITFLVFCIFKMSLLVPVRNSSCPLHQEDWGVGECQKADLKNSFPEEEKNLILFEGILFEQSFSFLKR